MKSLDRSLPNILTIMNLIAGLTGILFWQHDTIFAAWCIFFAMGFDFLDGFMARLLGATSEIGKQLDSLADIVSFGILPACVLFGVLYPDFIWMNIREVPLPGFLLAAIPVCAALRLAKFNIEKPGAKGFKGLPTPANALWIAAVPFIVFHAPEESIVFSLFSGQTTLTVMALAGSALMLIPVPLMALKFSNFSWKENAFRYLVIAGSVILFLLFSWAGIPLIIILYIVLSLFSPRKTGTVE